MVDQFARCLSPQACLKQANCDQAQSIIPGILSNNPRILDERSITTGRFHDFKASMDQTVFLLAFFRTHSRPDKVSDAQKKKLAKYSLDISLPHRCPTAGCDGLHSRAQQQQRRQKQPPKLIKCPTCQKKICLEDRLASLRECEALYARGLASMEDERVDEAIETLRDALKRFHQVARPPHRDTHLAEIALSSCLADSGNTWRPTAL